MRTVQLSWSGATRQCAGSSPLRIPPAAAQNTYRSWSETNLMTIPGASLEPTSELRRASLAASRRLCVSGRDEVRATTLANGMRVIVWPVHDIPNVALYNWVRAGSRNEAPGITGLAHFFEHMMFNGTTPPPARRVRSADGRRRAAPTTPSPAMTSPSTRTGSRASALDLVFDLESDRVAQPRLHG